MRRRPLMKSFPLAATLSLAGCLDFDSADEAEEAEEEPTNPDDEADEKPTYPEEWRHVDPFDSEYVTFEPGEFETTAGDPPAEGDTLDDEEVWQLVEEMASALREVSFRLSFGSTTSSSNQEVTWRRSLWRNAETDVVYQRKEVDRAREPVHTIRDYNDGTRYVSVHKDDGTKYYHVTDPHMHRYRVDSTQMRSIFPIPGYRAEDSVTVDGTELRRVRNTDDMPAGIETESAAFFIGEDGIIRNAHADYGTESDVRSTDQFSVDAAVEITAGTPEISEPEWTGEAGK